MHCQTKTDNINNLKNSDYGNNGKQQRNEQARNEKLTHYNDKYNTKLKASYRDEIASELSSLEKIQILDGGI